MFIIIWLNSDIVYLNPLPSISKSDLINKYPMCELIHGDVIIKSLLKWILNKIFDFKLIFMCLTQPFLIILCVLHYIKHNYNTIKSKLNYLV